MTFDTVEFGVGSELRLLSSLANSIHYPWGMIMLGPISSIDALKKAAINLLALQVIEHRFSGRPSRRLAAYHGVMFSKSVTLSTEKGTMFVEISLRG